MVLIDTMQILDVGQVTTEGFITRNTLTPVGGHIPGLVQSTVLQNAVESQTEGIYAIKVARGTAIHAGQAVWVVDCVQEPDLVGKILLLDKVSKNGLAMIRKAVATDFDAVDQQGKEAITNV